MDIHKILELDQLAREDGGRYKFRRVPLYSRVISSFGRHFTGIVGPRGAGKTIMLKQIAREQKDSFYLSVDTLEDGTLFEAAKVLTEKYGVKCLLLDEIHFQKGFEGDLKKIFDFLNVRLVFTSSVALAMTESAYDLSRRVRMIGIYPFSFREYLMFRKGIDLPVLTIADIAQRKWSGEHLRWMHAFGDYLKGGLHPFALEEFDIKPLLKNILQKIIQRDVPSIARLATDEINTIEKVVAFVGRSQVDGINYSSVAKNIGITKYKAEQYIRLLEESFILKQVFPFGTNVLKEPKVLMYLPYRLLFRNDEDAMGALREDFFAEAMTIAGKFFYYLKSTRGRKTPDFLFQGEDGDMVIEVGGKGKGRSQFKDFQADKKIRLTDSDEADSNRRPLLMLGYLI